MKYVLNSLARTSGEFCVGSMFLLVLNRLLTRQNSVLRSAPSILFL